MDKPKLLIVSHDKSFLSEHVQPMHEHFECQRSNSEEATFFLCQQWEPKVVLLDSDSPYSRALVPLRQVYKYSDLGILVLGHFGQFMTEAQAFENGADHYILGTKSWASVELRVLSLLRRLHLSIKAPTLGQAKACIRFHDIEIYPEDYLIKCQEKVLSTTPTQFKLMLALVSNRDQLLSREWIKERVWENANISPRSIDAQISKLKKVIPQMDEYLVNVYGKGYILTFSKKNVA